MTIRNTLLVSYLLVSLASALLITAMIFMHLKAILYAEIEAKLSTQAAATIQQIDTNLFERMENLALWSGLEIMQEIKVGDVDKRLAHFLADLQTGYDGVYQQIFVVAANNEIVSASNASLIGSTFIEPKPWLSATHKHHSYALQRLDENSNKLLFSMVIPDLFSEGELGRLYAEIEGHELSELLDAQLSKNTSQSYALVLDNNGEAIAVSTKLREQSLFSNMTGLLASMTEKSGFFMTQADLVKQEMLVAYAESSGYRGFKGFGWRVVIIQPSHTAFAQVWALWVTILVFLALTLALGVLASFWMSARIARPIVRLAEFTKEFMQGKQTNPPIIQSSLELTQLSTQFSLMINSLEQSKQDLVRVAKLAVIGEMAASMAHEVRTPLGILKSSAQILLREKGLSKIGQEMAEYILSETQRLNELITTLLECARPRPPLLNLQDLHFILEHTVDLLQTQADAKHIRIAKRFNAGQAELFCDRDHMIQVFLNLVMNAIQHVQPGGYIELGTRRLTDTLEVLVQDNGVGITDTHKAKIFEPFFTKRQDGIGLGLTVVQQSVLAHHGQIYVTDSDYGGACFHVVLPIKPQG